MIDVTRTKSANFDRNLDYRPMVKRIGQNTWAASEILKDTANSIAPIDHGDLRQDTTTERRTGSGFFSHFVTWNVPYAAIRYVKNFKNPSSKRWIAKGFKRKRKVLIKRMAKGVIKW